MILKLTLDGIELQEDCDEVKVLINGLLHFHFLRKHYRGMSSYNNGVYTIEILLKDQELILEYDNRETWETVLRLLTTKI